MYRMVIASALLLAAGAANASTPSPTNPAHPPGAQAATQAAPLRQEIRSQLAKAGLTDIKVAPEEYVVHAKNKNGAPVLMVVSPNSFMEVTDVKVATPAAQVRRNQVEPDPTPLAKQQ